MVAYKLNLKNNQVIELYFKENEVCSLIVGDSSIYEFIQEDDALRVNWVVKNGMGQDILESDIISIQSIEYKEDNLATTEELLTNCCSIGDKEFCVKNGCMNAPCGRICD